MEIMDFCLKVQKGISTHIGESVTVNIKKIVKNNGIILHSIVITEKERNISPNIYLDELYEAYESGQSFYSIIEEVLHIYEESRMKENVDMSFFLNYESMKNRVVYKLVNYEKNEALLLQVPHFRFMNLAIVFYCHVPGHELGSATILIYNNHLKMWNVTPKQLYEDAKKNTEHIMPPCLTAIEEIMQEFLLKGSGDALAKEGQIEDEWKDKTQTGQVQSAGHEAADGKMFVLGNEIKLFGAAVMLYHGLMQQIGSRLGRNYFILPSSVHEVILVPDDGEQMAGELWQMVCEINATQVEPEEVLADSLYYFSRNTNKIIKMF